MTESCVYRQFVESVDTVTLCSLVSIQYATQSGVVARRRRQMAPLLLACHFSHMTSCDVTLTHVVTSRHLPADVTCSKFHHPQVLIQH